MKILSLVVDYSTNEMTLRFDSKTDMNLVSAEIANLCKKDIEANLIAELRRLLKAGLKIDAIKLHRVSTGSSLQDALNHCTEILKNIGD
jgi:predicted methyltransferase